MNLDRRTDIQAYYDLSNCCNNDLAFVCKLLQFVEHKPKSIITLDFELLRVSKYEDNLNYLLDNLKTGTINTYPLIERIRISEMGNIFLSPLLTLKICLTLSFPMVGTIISYSISKVHLFLVPAVVLLQSF